MIKAIRDGIRGQFSDTDWKSGQPQRYGWREEGKEGKTLPKEIINFIERRKAPEPVKVENIEPENGEPTKVEQPIKVEKVKEKPEKLEFETALGETIIIKGSKVTKPKTKKDDHSKQKGRTPGKRKPGAVEKA